MGDEVTIQQAPEHGARYLTSTQVHERYGRRPPWAWRRQKRDPLFPAPMVIARQNYWSISELDAYDAAQKRRAVAPSPRERAPGQTT